MRHSLSRRAAAIVSIVALLIAFGTTAALRGADAAGLAPNVIGGTPVYGDKLSAPAPFTGLLMDQGIPVTLNDGRTLLIFADTANLFTQPNVFQTSSIALTDASNPTKLRLVLDHSGKPVEFLPRQGVELKTVNNTSYEGLWPMGATTLPSGRILISYSKYHVTLSPVVFTFVGSGLFQWEYPGADRLTPENSKAMRIADDMWTTADGPVNSPVYANGYVYFMSCGYDGCYSLRTTPEKVTDRTTYTWWTGSDWSPNRADRHPMTFGGGQPGRSASMQWVPQLGAYAMTDTNMGAPDTTGLLWLAERPQGPWSTAIRYPLTRCGSRSCYLPIVQPQASTASAVRINYSSGDTWGPTQWTLDLPLLTQVPQRTTTYKAPKALADTTTGLGLWTKGRLETNGWRHIWTAELDQASNVARVKVAVQVSGATAGGRLRVSPSGSSQRGQAVDYQPGTPTRVELELPVGANRRIAVTNEGAPADVKVDLLGWTTAAL